MSYGQALGEAIAKAREAAGLTQRQLGDELGVTNQTVSNWECGRYDVSVGTLARIEGITGTSGLMEAARQSEADVGKQGRRSSTGCNGYGHPVLAAA